MTEKRTIQQMLEDFRKDFGLNYAEVAVIAKPESPGYKERVEKMDAIRSEMNKLKNNLYNLMVKGEFDKVRADIAALNEGVYV